ncbi:transcriptional regulator, TetR family [gamma proteobacterium NOR5-3]|nr:transcriptional regulator, TetR family [gamma proteobacterium NOR5-3]
MAAEPSLADKHTAGGGLKSELATFKRRRIREEAAHLFFQQGYESATIDAIAERLKVTKPFIYSYYKNKGEILFDISRLGISVSLEALDNCLASPGSPWDRLKLIVDKVTRLILDNEENIVVYLREEKNLDETSAREIRELRSLFDHRLGNLLLEGTNSGEFTVDNPVLTATTIGGMMSWVALWYTPGGHWSETEVLATLIQNVARMVHSPIRIETLDMESRKTTEATKHSASTTPITGLKK